jgi:hypothetical protein
MRIGQLAISVLVGQFLVFNSCLWAQEATFTISLEKSVITLHEPTIVDVTINNSTSAPLDFDPGYGAERIEVAVVDPEGHVWKKQEPSPQEGMKFSQAVRVAPATSSLIPVLLNSWFPFEKIGNYQIAVTLSPSIAPVSTGLGGMSTQLTLTVLRRDQAELEPACAVLVKRIKNSHSAASSIVAAEALATVDDPAAVPFLVEAMEEKVSAGLMIGALARLKTTKAVEALVSASRSGDPETAASARAALTSLGMTVRK